MYLSATHPERIYASRARERDVGGIRRAVTLCRLELGKIVFGKDFIHSCKQSNVLFGVLHSNSALRIVNRAFASGHVNSCRNFLDVLAHPRKLIGIRKSDVRLEFAISQALHNEWFCPDESAIRTGILMEVLGALHFLAEENH